MSESGKQTFAAIRGMFFAALFITLWSWLAATVRRYDPLIGIEPIGWIRPLGWILAAGGGALAAACVAVFATRGKGTPAPFDPPRRFVATGPYRYVRNPMYVGAVGVMSGVGLVVGSPAILVLAIVFWALSCVFVLLYEEPDLERRFGESYAEYRGNVGRWIPRLPRQWIPRSPRRWIPRSSRR